MCVTTMTASIAFKVFLFIAPGFVIARFFRAIRIGNVHEVWVFLIAKINFATRCA